MSGYSLRLVLKDLKTGREISINGRLIEPLLPRDLARGYGGY